jgi:formylglycine-generating enzyme required for sulfatase activity
VQLAYAASNPNDRPTPRTLGALVTEEVEAVFRKAVAVKPEDRFQNAGDFWAALKSAHTGQPMTGSTMMRAAGLDSGRGQAAPAFAQTAIDPGPPQMSRVPTPPVVASKSKTGLVVGLVLGVLALAGGGAAFFALRGGVGGKDPPGGLASASASASAPAVSSVAVPAPAKCPAGMVLVPGGEFFMGSEEADALPFEKPPHKVKVSPYCLDELEVTVEKYKDCSDRGSCRRAGKINEWPDIKPAQRKIYDPLCNANDPAAKASHPINCVDWDQAREFCEAAGGRLPTEAEWEFAARGPDGRVYPWGDEKPSAKLLNACGKECVAWEKKHPDPDNEIAAMYDEDDGFPNTAPVGSFPAGKSRYGVKDVVGNVWEWVADWYADYDKASAQTMSVDPKGPEKGTRRVIRGGSWNGSQATWVRPSFRFHAAPSSRSYGFGFRCAKTP